VKNGRATTGTSARIETAELDRRIAKTEARTVARTEHPTVARIVVPSEDPARAVPTGTRARPSAHPDLSVGARSAHPADSTATVDADRPKAIAPPVRLQLVPPDKSP
jgi:hypothetical protein